jgi:hypothetical protein
MIVPDRNKGTLHKSCPGDLVTPLGNSAVLARLVRYGYPWHNTEVSSELPIVGKILDITYGI